MSKSIKYSAAAFILILACGISQANQNSLWSGTPDAPSGTHSKLPFTEKELTGKISREKDSGGWHYSLTATGKKIKISYETDDKLSEVLGDLSEKTVDVVVSGTVLTIDRNHQMFDTEKPMSIRLANTTPSSSQTVNTNKNTPDTSSAEQAISSELVPGRKVVFSQPPNRAEL
ncbi:MAG: hypothetical protein QM674_19180, partial [Burkholderiaceae bacterium]